MSALCAVLFLLCLTAAPAQAVTEHAFDPVLSLGGNCTTSPLDQVPDPGSCPGIPGTSHPTEGFDQPCGAAVDSHGDIYVSSAALGPNGEGTGGRVDIFGPTGTYLGQIHNEHQPCSVAVDSEGNLYVGEFSGKSVVRLDANEFPPSQGVEFEPPEVLFKGGPSFCETAWSVAVDPSNDNPFVAENCGISHYSSAASGNVLLEEKIAEDPPGGHRNVAVYGLNHDLYVPGIVEGQPGVSILDGANYASVKCTVKGLPNESASIAVDQANGDFYVDSVTTTSPKSILQFDKECNPISEGTLERSFEKLGIPIHSVGLAVDSSLPGQAGYDSPNESYVYVSQGTGSKSHVYAFKPKVISPPEIRNQGATAITETEALLTAELNAGGKTTAYHFELITQAGYEANGNSFGPGTVTIPVPDADGGEEASFISVSKPVAGLVPGTTYRLRLVATNCEVPGEEECLTLGEGIPGDEGSDAAFSTYPTESGLPDGRAYELVTPPTTNGRIPTMAEISANNNDGFDTALVSPDGESLVFGVRGGSLPLLGGGGFNDTYDAVRGADGWHSHFTGLSGSQAEAPYPGGVSTDHRYSFWKVEHNRGSFTEGNYLRAPDGSFEPIGIGSLGVDPNASGKWISRTGDRVIFATANSPVRLEPQAPPNGVAAIYERSPDGPTTVLSIPPAGASIAEEEEFEEFGAKFEGFAANGTTVVFRVNDRLYAHQDNGTGTREIASDPAEFAGISEDGERTLLFRPNSSEPLRPNPSAPATPGVPQGEIFVHDLAAGVTTPVGSGDESVLVNMSPNDSSTYFVSPDVLAPGAQSGEENLYAWNSSSPGTVSLVAILAERDVTGEPATGASAQMTDGLGLWVKYAVNPIRSEYQGLAADPSRTSAGSEALIFESRAALTPYENDEHSEIYRYDPATAPGDQLTCISCNPTGVAATSDALLQTPPGGQFSSFPPTNDLGRIGNLTDDGRRAFFQSADQLAASDIDGKIDVYEWVAQGTGACTRAGGCVHPISSGRSATNDYLYAVSPDGSNVFFETGDMLVSQDPENTPSIYDARVGGGFPAAPSPRPGCTGETCQPSTSGPADSTPASSNFSGSGNVKPGRHRCQPAKSKTKRQKTQCPKGHKKAQHPNKRSTKDGQNHGKRKASR